MPSEDSSEARRVRARIRISEASFVTTLGHNQTFRPRDSLSLYKRGSYLWVEVETLLGTASQEANTIEVGAGSQFRLFRH